MPAHHALEMHWVARDTLLGYNAATLGMSVIDLELATAEREALLEILKDY